MKAIDRSTQESIFISAYWPQRNNNESPIGYGMRKEYLFFQAVLLLFNIIARVTGWFFRGRALPLRRPGPRSFLLLISALSSILLFRRERAYTGFYQLDNEGRPVLFLSRSLPMSIQGRMGVSRKRFFAQKIDNE